MYNWCLSGGAAGADLMWGTYAKKRGHQVTHWSFAGHKSKALAEDLAILPQHELDTADPFCKLANATLQRYWPPRSQAIANLLRRNWFQVSFAESCYAISTFGIDPVIHIPIGEAINNKVNGGTAWAVQMFLDRFDRQECPCYVFDQDACYWFEWQNQWVRIYEPPSPKGIWAGVGTRKLNQIGGLAIKILLQNKEPHVKTK